MFAGIIGRHKRSNSRFKPGQSSVGDPRVYHQHSSWFLVVFLPLGFCTCSINNTFFPIFLGGVLAMAQQTDGAFSDGGFDPSKYSATLSTFSPRTSLSWLCVGDDRAVRLWCQTVVCFTGFFAEASKRATVVSRANSIGSTSASSVPNTGVS